MFVLISEIVQAANKAMSALNRIRAGKIAEDRRTAEPKSRVKRALSSLFKSNRGKKVKRQTGWKHTFICLAYRDQGRIPTTDIDKDELYEAGLGMKEIEFDSVDMSAEEFREGIFECYPKLKNAGGYMFFKCTPNSRKLEALSRSVYSSPAALKERVGSARTYIRPVQKDLDLEPITSLPQGVSLVVFRNSIKYLLITHSRKKNA